MTKMLAEKVVTICNEKIAEYEYENSGDLKDDESEEIE
jgi:hypothetical protein